MFDGLKSIFGSKKPGPGQSAVSSSAAPKVKAALPAPVSAAAGEPVQSKVKRANLARRFTIVGEIGQGSMSNVYRAVDNDSGRVVCLKVQDGEKTKAAMARSHRANRPTEGEVGQKIVHPNVVRTLEWGLTSKGDYYIVMEFIEGVSLTSVRESRPLDLHTKLDLLAQASRSLEAVHAAGFIHHDFGPKNLMVTSDNQVKLIDFGLSVPNTVEYRRPGNRTGTLTYMAPELLRREPKDEKIDIFSWGATAFEFLAGRPPYDVPADLDPMAALRTRVNSAPRKLAEIVPDMPPEVCEVIDRAVERNPALRWPTAARVTEAIMRIIGPEENFDGENDDDRTFDW